MLKKTPFLLVLGLVLFLQNCKKETPDPPASTADVVAPVITISVSSPFTQYLPTVAGNGTFVVPAATAIDNVDGDLTPAIVVTGSVNPNQAGTYPITYTVSDAAGNRTDQRITVIIENSIAYLAGKYMNVKDTCVSMQTYTYDATVTVSNTINNSLSIKNFGGFGASIDIPATVGGSNIIFQSQPNVGGGSYLVAALGTIMSTASPVKFKIYHTTTDGSYSVNCHSWYIRQ